MTTTFLSPSLRTATSEVWDLGNYVVLELLGQVHNIDAVFIMNYILKWVESGTVMNHMNIKKICDVVNNLVSLVDGIGKTIGPRKPASQHRFTGKTVKRQEPATPVKGMRRAISASSLSINAAQGPINQNTWFKVYENVIIINALRDHTRDMFRALINSLKAIMNRADPESKEVMDRLTLP